jgi:hypothetical protein
VTLHILVPGLLGPLPQAGDEAGVPRLPMLEMVLARADRRSGPADHAAAAFDLFGIDCPGHLDRPTAAVCFAYQTGMPADGWMMHADPVHLRPDQDRLILFDSRSLRVGADEAAHCSAAFNAHFAEDGLQLLAPTPEHWYLRLDRRPAVRTAGLGDVAGRNINRYLPQGGHRRFWRQLLNEVQMLFHGLEVNRAREAGGRLTISGIWCSGSGEMPARGRTYIRAIRGDDLLVNALAAHADVAGDDELWVETGLLRALLDADVGAWIDAAMRLDRQFAECLGAESDVRIYPCDGSRYDWRPAMRRRLWRRIVPLSRHLQAAHRAAAPPSDQTP